MLLRDKKMEEGAREVVNTVRKSNMYLLGVQGEEWEKEEEAWGEENLTEDILEQIKDFQPWTHKD